MRLRPGFLGAVVLCVLASTGSADASITHVGIAGSQGFGGLGAYTGQITYDDALGKLTVTLTNATAPQYGGYLTGLAFNVAGKAKVQFVPQSHDKFQQVTMLDAPLFGAYEHGVSTSSTFWGSGRPDRGLAIGQSRAFDFNVTGRDAGKLTAMSFVSEMARLPCSCCELDPFMVRFRGFPCGWTDLVPGAAIPEPAAAALLLSGAALLTLRRRSRAD